MVVFFIINSLNVAISLQCPAIDIICCCLSVRLSVVCNVSVL